MSNFSAPFTENFLGSNEPTPPAIIMLGERKVFFLLVIIFQFSLSLFTSSTLSFKWKFVLKAFDFLSKTYKNMVKSSLTYFIYLFIFNYYPLSIFLWTYWVLYLLSLFSHWENSLHWKTRYKERFWKFYANLHTTVSVVHTDNAVGISICGGSLTDYASTRQAHVASLKLQFIIN